MAIHNVVPTPSFISNMQPWLSLVGMLMTGGLGYWWGHRGISGMKTDLQLLKSDIEYLKGKLNVPQTPTTPTVTTTPVVVAPTVPATSS